VIRWVATKRGQEIFFSPRCNKSFWVVMLRTKQRENSIGPAQHCT
jgi:hypothetical protein